MAKLLISDLFLTLVPFIFFGLQACAVTYDPSFTTECLAKPLSPQYNGGIVVNPELNEGLKGWTTFGNAMIKHEKSSDGNSYIVASNRSQSYDSSTQTFDLETGKIYTFSAWFQVSNESAEVEAIFKTKTSYEIAGFSTAQNGCWSMMKGGFNVIASGPAQLYFESNDRQVDIWVDSVSLQPFTEEEWLSPHPSTTDEEGF